MLAAGSCVCFGQAFNLFYDPCLTLSGREQRVSSSIIRLGYDVRYKIPLGQEFLCCTDGLLLRKVQCQR